MTLFEYDASPVTQQVVLLGSHASPAAYLIRDFLTRNGRFYRWVDVDDPAQRQAYLGDAPVDLADLPICILPDGTRLAPAALETVAAGLGMITAPTLAEYDLAIVGAGPSGLAAAVYAASEGLTAAVIEAVAPGGQAGTTSMIENYLGFPTGISGSELTNRAVSQARRFGAEILLARRLAGVDREDRVFTSRLSDGTHVRSRALLLATGVEWRRLEVPGIDELLGAGVYYGAGPSEAQACRGSRVVVVGGGNSAGQAVVRFSRYASEVTLLVRGPRIGDSMSHYLVEHLASIANVRVRTGSQVVGFETDGRLRGLLVQTAGRPDAETLPAESLFICIGGTPRSEGAVSAGIAADAAGYITTGGDLAEAGGRDRWPLSREPLPLETNFPGVFASGDVRHGSIKRCAAAIGEGAMAVALVHRHLESADG